MRLRSICPASKNIVVQPLSSPSEMSRFTSNQSIIAVTHPRALLRVEPSLTIKVAQRPSLVVLEDLHLLDDEYELAVARILSMAVPSRTRIVGLTSSINDPSDLAKWLGVEPAFRYSFYPRDRSTPLLVSIKSFTIPHSATLLKTMIKPAYDIIKMTAGTGRTIVFAPSRAACRSVAKDLVTQSGTEMDLNGFLTASREHVEPYLQRLKDRSLYEPLLHGIGYAILDAAPSDLALVLQLFASDIIRALIVPRESCWTLPLRSSSVIILGAQYAISTKSGDRQIINYSRTDLVKMQGFAVESANHTGGEGRVFVMCQSEQSQTISRILNDGLPLESSLPAVMKRQSHPEVSAAFGRLFKSRDAPPPPQTHRRGVPDLRKRDIMDFVGWTYFSYRVKSNPIYYDIHRGSEADELSRLVDGWIAGTGEEFGPVPHDSGSSYAGSKLSKSTRSGSTSTSLDVSRAVSALEVENGQSRAMSREGSAEGVQDGDIGEEVLGEAGVNANEKMG